MIRSILKLNTLKTGITVFISIVAFFITSCTKEDDNDQAMVPGQTSIRLVHSSAISNTTALDLYVNDVKVTVQPIPFRDVSDYFPATSGSKKIGVKTADGTAIMDTLLNIRDGHQYSVYVIEWRSYSTSSGTPPVITIAPSPVRGIILSDDNNTTIPDTGDAKVRFVNCIGSNDFFSTSRPAAIFYRVNAPLLPLQEYLTYNLTDKASDYLSITAGPLVFRATALNSAGVAATVTMEETTLEAGKLYTIYLTGSPGGVPPTGGATAPSSLELKIVAFK